MTSTGSGAASEYLRNEAAIALSEAEAARRVEPAVLAAMAATETRFALRSLAYYHGRLTQRAAAQLLIAPGVGQGTFLLHFAHDRLTLSVNAGRRALHVPLLATALGVQIGDTVFGSMAELLQEYRRQPLPLTDATAVLRGYLPPLDTVPPLVSQAVQAAPSPTPAAAVPMASAPASRSRLTSFGTTTSSNNSSSGVPMAVPTPMGRPRMTSFRGTGVPMAVPVPLRPAAGGGSRLSHGSAQVLRNAEGEYFVAL